MSDFQQTTPNTKPNLAKQVWDKIVGFKDAFTTFGLFVLAFVTAVLLNAFVFQPYEVDGTSMQPTLNDGDRLIVFKLGKTWENIRGNQFIPKRGEILVFNKTGVESSQLIKRVVGLPGERVMVKDGIITVFNQEVPTGFNPDTNLGVSFAQTFGEIDIQVGTDELFVVGDNRIPGASLDSRSTLGNVKLKDTVGTLALRIFPFSDFERF